MEEPTIHVTLQAAERLLLNVPEAAHRLGISRSRLYQIIGAGDIETVTIGRLRKIPTVALEDYVEGRRSQARA